MDYLTSLGMDAVEAYEHELACLLYSRLSAVPGLRLYGPDPARGHARAALVAFNHESVHAGD